MKPFVRVLREAGGVVVKILAVLSFAFIVFQTSSSGGQGPRHVLLEYARYVADLVLLDVGQTPSGLSIAFFLRGAPGRSLAILLPPVVLAAGIAFLGARRRFIRERYSAPVIEHIGGAAHALPIAFVVTILFVIAVETGAFPIGGVSAPSLEDAGAGMRFLNRVHHLLLPWITLFLYPWVLFGEAARARTRTLAGSTHVIAAQAQGFCRREVFALQVRREVIAEIAERAASAVPVLITYLMLVEQSFQYPGLGYHALRPYTAGYLSSVADAFAISQPALVYLVSGGIVLQFASRAASSVLTAKEPAVVDAVRAIRVRRSIVPLLLVIAAAAVAGAIGDFASVPAPVPLLILLVPLVLAIKRDAEAVDRSRPVFGASILRPRGALGDSIADEGLVPDAQHPKRGWRGVSIGVLVVAILVLVAVVVPWILPPPDPPSRIVLLHPDPREHPELVLYYLHLAVVRGRGLVVAIAPALLGGVLGVVLAAAVALRRAPVVERLIEWLSVYPSAVLLVMLPAVLAGVLPALLVTLGIIATVRSFRLFRVDIEVLRERSFVAYASSIGLGPGRVALRHILPNLLPAIRSRFFLLVADLIVLKANLSYLGIGRSGIWRSGVFPNVHRPATGEPFAGAVLSTAISDWGTLLASARSDFVRGRFLPALFPAALLVLVVVVVRILAAHPVVKAPSIRAREERR